jgi:hypothetical protein
MWDWRRSANGTTYPDPASDIGHKGNEARRSLPKMKPDYMVKFLWIFTLPKM